MCELSTQSSVHSLPLFSSTTSWSRLGSFQSGIGCGCFNVWRLDVGVLAPSRKSCLYTQVNLLLSRILCPIFYATRTFFFKFSLLILSSWTGPSILQLSDQRSAALRYKRRLDLHAPSSQWIWIWTRPLARYRRQQPMDQDSHNHRRLSVARNPEAASFPECLAPWSLNTARSQFPQKCRANLFSSFLSV